MADPIAGMTTHVITGLLTTLITAGSVRTAATDTLVVLALALIMVAAIGLTFARSAVTRLHFLAPASTVALPIFGLAAIINQGLTLGSAAVAVSVAAAALSAPVLTTSIGRLVAAEDADGGRAADPRVGDEPAREGTE